MKTLAIIGFGFCGRLSFFHLSQKQKAKILIFDKDGIDAFVPAFSGFSPHYILNVPAVKMSAFSQKPQDFCEFLKKNYPEVWNEVGENGFAPRHIYDNYLAEITKTAFADAQKNGIEFEFKKEEITNIKKLEQQKFLINKTYLVDEIFLATSLKQSDLPFESQSKNVIKKLWDKNFLEFHKKKFDRETICIIGSGLSAVDVLTGLKKKGFSGKIFVISRRGNFPKKHLINLNQSCPNLIHPDDSKRGMVFLCLKIRKFLKENPQFDLRHVVDSVRLITIRLWQNFDQKNKEKFLRLMPYWSIFRHRAPIESVEIIEKMIASKQLEVIKSAVGEVFEKDDKIFVQTKSAAIKCDYLVNGLGFEFRAKKYPLLAQMIEDNLLEKDVLLARSRNQKIHLLGALNLGRDFECTSVPDLRASVEKAVEFIF